MNNISVEDATNSYLDAEAKFILASNEFAIANAAYNAAVNIEQSTDELVNKARGNLAKVVSEAVHT